MTLTKAICLSGLAGLTTAWLAIEPDSAITGVETSTRADLTRQVTFEPADLSFISEEPSSLPQDPALDAKVSVSFHGATLDDVLKWLSSQGISFVADQTFPKPDARLSMRIENQSLRDLLLAVADVFGGAWQKQGDLYVLKARTNTGRPDSLAAPEQFRRFDLRDPQRADEFAKRIKEWSERFANEWKHSQAPDFKALEDLLKELREQYGHGDWKDFRGGRMFVFPPGEWKPILPDEFLKDFPELKARIDQFRSGALPEFVPDLKEWREKIPKIRFGGDLKKLFDSITPEQWKIQEERGWLTPDDLSEGQRALLGFQGGGAIEIKIVINGKSLTIKSS